MTNMIPFFNLNNSTNYLSLLNNDMMFWNLKYENKYEDKEYIEYTLTIENGDIYLKDLDIPRKNMFEEPSIDITKYMESLCNEKTYHCRICNTTLSENCIHKYSHRNKYTVYEASSEEETESKYESEDFSEDSDTDDAHNIYLRSTNEHIFEIATNATIEKSTNNEPSTIRYEEDDKYLNVTLTVKNNKYIINNKVALLKRHWHTLVGTRRTLSCVLCGFHVKRMDTHMEDRNHLQYLSERKDKILKEFGYSIVMETNKPNIYHCGVCNIIIESLNDVRVHIKSEAHLINLNRLKKRRCLKVSDFGSKNKHISGNKETNATEDKNKYLNVTLIKQNAAYVINNKVALLKRNWHTLVGTKKTLFCVLCDVHVKRTDTHLEDRNHVQYLSERKDKILKEFGYSIVMETNKPNIYHCGVCNSIIQTLNNVREHCKSENHLFYIDRFHKRCVQLTGNKTTINKDSIKIDTKKKYLKINTINKDHSSYFINKTVSIVRIKWHGLKIIDELYVCPICDVRNKKMDNVIKNNIHKRHMDEKVQYILSAYGYSLVYEIPIKYKCNFSHHCGACNMYLNKNDLVNHAKEDAHNIKIGVLISNGEKIKKRQPWLHNTTSCLYKKNPQILTNEYN